MTMLADNVPVDSSALLEWCVSSIIRFGKRRFANSHEMSEAIVERMNSCIQSDDTLYFLGDVVSWHPEVCDGLSRTACLQNHPFHREKPRQDATETSAPGCIVELAWRGSMSANRASCSATIQCGYERIMLAAPGACTDIRTAICRTNRWRFQWTLTWIGMISAPGTPTKFRQS